MRGEILAMVTGSSIHRLLWRSAPQATFTFQITITTGSRFLVRQVPSRAALGMSVPATASSIFQVASRSALQARPTLPTRAIPPPFNGTGAKRQDAENRRNSGLDHGDGRSAANQRNSF